MPKAAIALRNKERRLHPTHNDLPAERRQKLVDILNARLADAIDLMLQCKQAHWNVRGPAFAGLHALFDEAHDDARTFVDDIAERAAALGGQVDGTKEAAASGSSLPAYPKDLVDGAAHAEALARAMATFAKLTRAAIDKSAALDDAVTADLFTSMTRALDKRLWMIEAHSARD